MRKWIRGYAVFGCALLTLSIAYSKTNAQARGSQVGDRPANSLSLEGPAIHKLVAEQLPREELRQLVTDSRTLRDHPDLSKYYRNKAQRLELEAEKYGRFARAAGDAAPLNKPDHYNVGRTARFDYLNAKDELRQAREASLLAVLNEQAERREGCFQCHSLHGRGGKIGPDLAVEGTRNRSDAWLIGHFKDPQAYSPSSVMPPVESLTKQGLKTLTTFLQYQQER